MSMILETIIFGVSLATVIASCITMFLNSENYGIYEKNYKTLLRDDVYWRREDKGKGKVEISCKECDISFFYDEQDSDSEVIVFLEEPILYDTASILLDPYSLYWYVKYKKVFNKIKDKIK